MKQRLLVLLGAAFFVSGETLPQECIPTRGQEICEMDPDDGIDNDCDGLVDMDDPDGGPTFRRGDINYDQVHDIADVIRGLEYLFLGGRMTWNCEDVHDCNDDGVLDVSDPVHLLMYLFLGGEPPPAPFDRCGVDPTEDPIPCVAAFCGC